MLAGPPGLEGGGSRSHLLTLPYERRARHARGTVQGIFLSATDLSGHLHQSFASRVRGLAAVAPAIVLAVALAGCERQQQAAAAPPPPPVTVAQPVKRTVTDWDEFTGRFEAVEEVQVRPRVGGSVTSVEFKDGDMVHTGDLLYVIDSASVRGGRRAGQRPARRCAGQDRARKARPRPWLVPGPDQRSLRTGRRPAPPGIAGRPRRRDAGRGCAEGGTAQHRVHPCAGADHGPRRPPSRHRRQSRAGQRQWHVDAAHYHRVDGPDLHLFRRGRSDLSEEQ